MTWCLFYLLKTHSRTCRCHGNGQVEVWLISYLFECYIDFAGVVVTNWLHSDCRSTDVALSTTALARGANAIASVCPSVRLSVRFHSNLWTQWPQTLTFACAWVTTTATLWLKVKAGGKGQTSKVAHGRSELEHSSSVQCLVVSIPCALECEQTLCVIQFL